MKKLHITNIIERFTNIHNNKYDYSLFTTYAGQNNQITIICPIHNIFYQTVKSHLRGAGCNKCANNIKKTTEQFITEAQNIHSHNKYDYSKTIYTNNINKIIIICSTHGDYLQSPVEHLSGKGCKSCANDLYKKSTEQFIKEAHIIHQNKYIYDKFIYISSNTKGIITCPIHNDFMQSPNAHLSHKDGCPKCGIESRKFTLEYFKTESATIHNNKYNYDLVIEYKNACHKLSIQCPIHGVFRQTPGHHLAGKGCPNCVSSISKKEISWLNSLNIPQEYRQSTLKIASRLIKPDAYDPTTNIIYEFYGNFWHGNPRKFSPTDFNPFVKKTFGELYQATLEREQLIKSAGYNLVTIWESDFDEQQLLPQLIQRNYL